VNKFLTSIVLLIGIILAGCSGTPEEGIPTQVGLPTAEPTLAPTQTAEPTDIPQPTPTEFVIPKTIADDPDEQAYMRVINATTQIGVLDVYVEALAIATNLEYGTFTPREEIASGRYTIRILPTGSFLTDPPLYEETLTIFGGESLIFVITGTPENLVFTRLNESNEPLQNDTSRLMMVNALTNSSSLIMQVNGVAQTAVTQYLQISEITTNPARRVTLTFQNAGTTVIEQIVDLRERENYTMLVLGDTNQPDDIQLLLLNSSAPGLTEISIVNAAPSIGLVDIYFAGDLLIGGASYGENSVPEAVLSGTYDISVYPEGANPDEVQPITGTQFVANPDELIVLMLVGEPSTLRFVTYRSNPQPTYDNQARISFVNSLESVPIVQLQSTNPELDQRLTYGRVIGNIEIPIDESISFTWIQQLPDSQDIALENFSDFTPEAGLNYLYIFAGRGFDTPILLSYEVGTLGFDTIEPADDDDATPIPTSRPTEVRFLNLWEGLRLNVRVDGTIVAEGIEYGLATNELLVESGERTILFSNADGDIELVEITREFDVASNYTIIAYENRFDPQVEGDVLVFDDTQSIITGATSGIRLAILEASPNSRFGIGYSEPTDQLSQPDASEDYRRSLSIGIEQIIRNITDNTASEVQRIPTGDYNIRIIDNDEIALTFTHTQVTLNPETLYNVFLWENPNTQETTSIIIPYSSP